MTPTEQPRAWTYEPNFDVEESSFNMIGSAKVGQKIRVLIGFVVVEKTKNYTILRVTYIAPENPRKVV